jgi:predicted chitinase
MSSKENADSLMKYAQSQGIVDTKELANFMGQMQVESMNFTSLEESFHYSGKRLYQIFPGRNGMDSVAKADGIVKGGPESTANAMYGGDWGKRKLGNTEPGDGWRFRGRGYVQLTGRDLYKTIGNELGVDLVGNPDLVASKDVAAKAAVQYWKDRVIRYGHEKDVDKATHAINSASEGLKERRAAAAAWERKLEQGYVSGATEPVVTRTLKQGMHGEDVRSAQEELHRLGYLQGNADSRFGPATEKAVEAFQHDQALDADGKIGSATRQHLAAAARDQQIADFVSSSGSTGSSFADAGHPPNAMYSTLKAMFPPGTSEARLAQGTAACYAEGMTDPKDLAGVFIGDDAVLFISNSMAMPARMDINQPAPSVQLSAQRVEQLNPQQAPALHPIQAHGAQLQQQ